MSCATLSMRIHPAMRSACRGDAQRVRAECLHRPSRRRRGVERPAAHRLVSRKRRALLFEAWLEVVMKRALIAVTGAGGFIGSAYAARLSARGEPVRRFVHDCTLSGADADIVAIDLAHASVNDLADRLGGVFALVHLAGRAHVMNEPASDPDATYKTANVDVTERLALACVAAGVRRFMFASTVKVNGEGTLPGAPFRPGDAPAPQDAYARSKLAAERALAQVASGTSMLATNLRLPLVYGPGARGNFRRLVEAIATRRLLPLGAIDNRRSLLGLDNLLDALDAALAAQDAVVGTHFVADADSV